MQPINFCPSSNAVKITAIFLVLTAGRCFSVQAQQKQASETPAALPASTTAIQIADDPLTVDPMTLVPPKLAVPVSVKFDGETLKAVFTWLQQTQSINLLVDYKALAAAKVLDTDPVYETLDNAPLYLLLNRLETLGLAWYMQDETLQITSRDEYKKHDTTVSYNLGDLFDAGYPQLELLTALTHCSPGRWDGEGDGGGAVLLGDVLFVRQTDDIQQQFAGLLAAIRKHGRRTFAFDSPRNAGMRLALDQKVAVDFQETPLVVAVQELADQAKINIRLDRAALKSGTIRERTPITLKVEDQKLSAVLKSMLTNLGMSWYLKDDVLWIAANEVVNQFHKTAVFDVRDLCRDHDESVALKDAIQKQTRARWRAKDDRSGVLEIPKPGVLVARHTEAALDEVLQLLENYRTAFRASKLRVTVSRVLDPAEVITGFYRLPRPLARDLETALPKLIQPNTWKSTELPNAIGTIQHFSADSHKVVAEEIVSEEVVLMIQQTRAAHQQIGKLVQSLTSSKSVDSEATIDTSRKPAAPTGVFGRGLMPAAK